MAGSGGAGSVSGALPALATGCLKAAYMTFSVGLQEAGRSEGSISRSSRCGLGRRGRRQV